MLPIELAEEFFGQGRSGEGADEGLKRHRVGTGRDGSGQNQNVTTSVGSCATGWRRSLSKRSTVQLQSKDGLIIRLIRNPELQAVCCRLFKR
jgi:hypothetical protein